MNHVYEWLHYQHYMLPVGDERELVKQCHLINIIIWIFQDILEFWHKNFAFPDKLPNQHILTYVFCVLLFTFITFIWYHFLDMSRATSRIQKHLNFFFFICCPKLNLSDLFHVPLFEVFNPFALKHGIRNWELCI